MLRRWGNEKDEISRGSTDKHDELHAAWVLAGNNIFLGRHNFVGNSLRILINLGCSLANEGTEIYFNLRVNFSHSKNGAFGI